MKPLILVNFKTYLESTGKNAVRLAKICQKVAKKSKVSVLLSVQAVDVRAVADAVKIPVWAEHVDNVACGRNTGFVSPESVKFAGAKGTLLNHAEHKLDRKTLKETLLRCKSLNMATMVCAASVKESVAVAALKPDFLAVEPPKLIGTGVSVSEANPGIITGCVRAVRKLGVDVPIVCGAGITNGDDVKKALELGSRGVLVASGVVKAKDQESAIRELVKHVNLRRRRG